MKKITPVFGPQELFAIDGINDDTEIVICSTGVLLQFCNVELAIKYAQKNFNLQYKFKIAHRRIEEVRAPKRWTIEDQNAGRLPEVGDVYKVSNAIVKHLGVGARHNSETFYFQYQGGNCGDCHSSVAIPLETPDETAARLEDAFVDSEYNKMNRKDLSGQEAALIKLGMRTAYRTMVSDLPR